MRVKGVLVMSLFLVASFLACPINVYGAHAIFMEIEGIDGACNVPGHENNIMVHSFSHSISMPATDPIILHTSRSKHAPIEILKECDKTSPVLFEALCEGRNINKVTIRFYEINSDPSIEMDNYFTIEVEKVFITKVSPNIVNENGNSKHMEIVSFEYEKIKWEYKSQNSNVSTGFDVAANQKI